MFSEFSGMLGSVRSPEAPISVHSYNTGPEEVSETLFTFLSFRITEKFCNRNLHFCNSCKKATTNAAPK